MADRARAAALGKLVHLRLGVLLEETMEATLLAATLVVVVSVLLVSLAARTGAPVLLLFLGIGMLLGVDGPGGVNFEGFEIAYATGGIALAVVLFAGGLETDRAELRKAAAPAFVLATVGTVVTAIVVALLVHWLFGTPLVLALLLGAVIGSTDAAATFLLLQQGRVELEGNVKETILIESGLNDPMAIFLTTTFVAWADSGVGLSWQLLPEVLPELALQLGGGGVAGVAGGFVLAALVDRLHLPAGLYTTLVLAGALAVFSATQLAGASGFLAIYLVGIVVRARVYRPMQNVRDFHDGMAWLAQVFLFLMLGLLVTPSDLAGSIASGLLIAAILIFVARPVATFVCLTPFATPPRRQLYVAWVGLRGAVPIFLAIIPVVSPGPVTHEFFDEVFVVVITSLVLQGWTVAPAARWLGVVASKQPGSPHEPSG